MSSLASLAVIILGHYLFGRLVAAVDRESFGFRDGLDGEDAPSPPLKIVARALAIGGIVAALYFPEGGLKFLALLCFIVGMAGPLLPPQSDQKPK